MICVSVKREGQTRFWVIGAFHVQCGVSGVKDKKSWLFMRIRGFLVDIWLRQKKMAKFRVSVESSEI